MGKCDTVWGQKLLRYRYLQQAPSPPCLPPCSAAPGRLQSKLRKESRRAVGPEQFFRHPPQRRARPPMVSLDTPPPLPAAGWFPVGKGG
jgi:hypothetical protein